MGWGWSRDCRGGVAAVGAADNASLEDFGAFAVVVVVPHVSRDRLDSWALVLQTVQALDPPTQARVDLPIVAQVHLGRLMTSL